MIFENSRRAGMGRGGMLAYLTPSLICGALLATCLILTVSRGATTATLLSCGALLIWEMFARDWRGIRKSNFTYGSVAAGALVILAWSGDFLAERYASSVGDWIDQRQLIYSVHWDAFLASPWFGYGLGTFDQVNKLVETAINYPALWNIRAAHNVYLQWLEEGGIAASLPMFACLGWIIFRTALGVRHRRRMTTWLRGIVCLSILVLIHGWSDFSLEVPAISMLWALLLGSGYAIATSTNSTASGAHNEAAEKPSEGPSLLTTMRGMVAISTFAPLTAALCFGSWAEIWSPFGLQPAFFPISNVFGYQAEQLLESDGPGHVSDDDIFNAYALTQRELSLSPAHAEGWLRLSAISALQKQPGSEISKTLDRSYLLAPLDPQLFAKRTRFAFDHWDQISPNVRNEVLAQIRVSWGVWIQKSQLLKLSNQVRNPAGRLAIRLVIAELSSATGLAVANP